MAAPPAVLVFEVRRQGRREITDVSPAAAVAGVRPGMTRTEAAAICPSLRSRPADHTGDRAARLDLATALRQRFSPLVGLDEGPAVRRESGDPWVAPGLWLDVTGCERLFGTEAGLIEALRTDLNRRGLFSARIGVAPTLLAARAIAVAGTDAQRPTRVLPTGVSHAVAALYPLPVGALPVSAETLSLCADLALDTLGDLWTRLDRDLCAARFPTRDDLLGLLDQAAGRQPTPLVPLHDAEPLQVLQPLDGPTDRLDTLLFLLKQMTSRLHAALEAAAQGALELHLLLDRASADQPPVEVTLVLSTPQRDAQQLFELLRERLERIDLTHPIDELALTAKAVAPLAAGEVRLYAEDEGSRGAQAARQAAEGLLLDRLRGRLGDAQVGYLEVVESHVPELASRRSNRPPPRRDADASPVVTPLPPDGPRPSTLFEEPVPIVLRQTSDRTTFRYAGQQWSICDRFGPERIESHWWDMLPHTASDSPRSPQMTARDYVLALTEEGPAVWIFRDRHHHRWFLHGIFD